MTTTVKPLFSYSIQETIELIGLSQAELYEDAQTYAENRGQTASNFKASWIKWENGGNMPMKIEDFFNTYHGDRFAASVEPASKTPAVKDILAEYKAHVIAEYIAANPCACRQGTIAP